jgi:hypothetical protein
MKRMLAMVLGALAAGLLSGCGGGNEAQPQLRALAQRTVQAAAAVDYQEVVQQLYVAYFGRPADTGGLANFTAQMEVLGAPVGIQDLDFAYTNNANVRALIDSFGNSAESAALYSGDNEVFVTAIYANVLNRVPDAEGKAFWLSALNSGGLTRARASFTIMAAALVNGSAQGLLGRHPGGGGCLQWQCRRCHRACHAGRCDGGQRSECLRCRHRQYDCAAPGRCRAVVRHRALHHPIALPGLPCRRLRTARRAVGLR